MEYLENIKVPSSEGEYHVCGSDYFTDKLQHMLNYLEGVSHTNQLHFQLSADKNDDHYLTVNMDIDDPSHYDYLSLINEIKGMLEMEYKQYSEMRETHTSYNVNFVHENEIFMRLIIKFTDFDVNINIEADEFLLKNSYNI